MRHYRFGRFVLDTQTRELRRDGAPVALTAKAFDTLQLLVEQRHRVVAKDELLATVWNGRVVEENNLPQAISALRRAFGTGAGDHRYIVTVPGRGYRFVAEVADEDDGVDAPSVVSPATVASPQRTGSPRWWLVLALAAAALALAALPTWRAREAADATAVPATLAVLPFRTASPDAGDVLLGLGLADTLVDRLSRSPALRVRALASARQLDGGDAAPDPVASGRRLQADYVVAGATRRVEDGIRVDVRLLSVDDGRVLWSDTLHADPDRAFTLRDRIGDAVVHALGLPAEPAARDPGSPPCDGEDPLAWRALLRAQYLQQRRSPETIAAFHQAIAHDPTCARAYAGLTLAYLFRAHNDGDPSRLIPLARAASAQAVRLAPGSADALVARGRQKQLQEWDWAGAEALLRQAIAANPSHAEAHFALAHLLVATGRTDEGLVQAATATELDPLSPLMVSLHAGFLTAAGRSPEAQRRLADALALQPDFWIALAIRGSIALERGDTATAIADLGRSVETSRRASQILALLAIAHAQAGQRERAEAVLRDLLRQRAQGYVPATSVAAARLALGQRREALDELERAYAERDIRMAFLKVDSRWNGLRDEPRFRALSARLGLSGGRASGRY